MASVLITGGAGGIGSEISYSFARHGYDIGIHYASGSERAELLADKLKSAFGIRALTFHADISENNEINEMFNSFVSELGAPDVLINNAGFSEQKLISEITPELWEKHIGINLSGAFFLCQKAAEYMVQKKHGSIVNISSIWGISGGSCETAYSAAKAGLIGLTKSLAWELGPSGIRVNCVAPGIIATKMNSMHSQETLDALAADTPLCRLGLPHEVAAAVYFLASDDASFITGQTLCVDGGFIR